MDDVERAFQAGFDAGFDASGEGFNAEYPFACTSFTDTLPYDTDIAKLDEMKAAAWATYAVEAPRG